MMPNLHADIGKLTIVGQTCTAMELRGLHGVEAVISTAASIKRIQCRVALHREKAAPIDGASFRAIYEIS